MIEPKFIGVFDDEEPFNKAVQELKDSNIRIEEIYAPIPVHHAVKNVAGTSNLPLLAYFFGLFAILGILSFLYYAAVISWPLTIGGKPSNAFPSFVIVTLVLTILTVTLLSLFAFSVSAKLYPGKKAVTFSNHAMDNKFIIVFKLGHQNSEIEDILNENGVKEIKYFNVMGAQGTD